MLSDAELEAVIDEEVFSAADMLRFASHAILVAKDDDSDPREGAEQIRRLLSIEVSRRVYGARRDIEDDVDAQELTPAA
jgi:hypothetical protein